MAEYKGAEPILFRWKYFLETEMATHVAAINDEFEDFVLPDLVAVYVGGSDGRALWPSAWLSDDDPQNVAPVSSGGYISYPVRLEFLDCDEGSGYQQLEQRLWRYQRAGLEIVSEHKSASGYWIAVGGIQPIAAPPVPTEENQNQFAAVKGLRFWCMAPETF